ncbi:RNA polymerase sigma factor [Paraburkholderia sp. J94]|uniref:RNA polymerase sigma factor n=1 Tax=Paraburkholderia sp. J94 TaxID=2805441 RepID=UPI002AB2A73C|nr:RNA polymerase sigma factor [Paraburkholderia sp. J94]
MDFRHQLVDQVPRLRRYARALMRCREQADDLVQDTLERALNKRALFQNGTDLRAWTFTLMHNVYVNTILKKSEKALHMGVDEKNEWFLDEMVTTSNPSRRLEIRDLERALMQIPDEQLQVVLLVGVEECSYAEIALALDIPIGTVMSRLSRGRERLRLLMSMNSPRKRSKQRMAQ